MKVSKVFPCYDAGRMGHSQSTCLTFDCFFADIELLLTAVGVLDKSQIPGAANYENGSQKDDGNDSEDEGFGGNRRKAKPTIRSQEDDDADLDWDI